MKSYSTLHSFFRGDDPKNLYRSTSYKRDKDAENACDKIDFKQKKD
jgi:hypothetical protein